jgi:hypothetical protein
MFAEFNAGMINKEQLKKQWAEKTIGTEKKMNQRWRLYQNIDGRWEPVPGKEWNGYSEEQVKNAVWSKYGREALDSGEYQLVNMGEQDWEVYDVKTGKTLEIVKGKSKGEVADAVFDKYVNQGIGFQVRPYEDPAKLTPRAKLAKRIATKKIDYNYDIVSRNSNKVMDRFYARTPAEADQVYGTWLKSRNLPNDTEDYGYRKSEQSAGVQDVDVNVAQNFALTQAVDATGELVWEIYDRQSGRAIEEILASSRDDAESEAEAWLESIGAQQPELFGVRPKMEA